MAGIQGKRVGTYAPGQKEEKPGQGELIYEYFINKFLTPWFQSKRSWVTASVYNKARGELNLLKTRKQAKGKSKQNPVADNPRVEMITKDKLAAWGVRQDYVKPVVPNSGRPTQTPRRPDRGPTSPAGGGRQGSPQQKQAEEGYYIQLQQLILENAKLKQKVEKRDDSISELYVKLDYSENTARKLIAQLDRASGEVTALKTRLSKLASDKLRENNPGIADLSDPFRPTEIGARFSAIYDDQWSDVYEHMAMDDDQKIHLLYEVVLAGYEFCDDAVKRQLQQIQATMCGEMDKVMDASSIVGLGSSDDKESSQAMANISIALKDTRKELAPKASKNFAKTFVKSLLPGILEPLDIKEMPPTLKKFAKHCVELCWFMVIQDPPVVMSGRCANKPFDVNIHRPYTVSVKGMRSPVVGVEVWPALYLHTNGPVLAKGVAQPTEGDIQEK